MDSKREPGPADGFRQLAFALDWEGFDCDCAQCATGMSRCGLHPRAHGPEGLLWMRNLFIEAIEQWPEVAPVSKPPENDYLGL